MTLRIVNHVLLASALGIVSLAAVVGCGSGTATSDASPLQRVTVDQLTDSERQLLARADLARQSLAGSLKAKLVETISTTGPVEAIAVCSEAAPEIARQVASEQQLRIGRTSHRLRNPANAPPEWAQSWIDAQFAEPVYLRRPEGLNVLVPIRLEAACLICHGDQNSMPADLVAAISARYPDDRAKGFREGDLRGWFWVEVDEPENDTP